MTVAAPAWPADYGGTPEAIDRFQLYVSHKTLACVYESWKKIGTKPVPFSCWRWHRVVATSHSENSRDWSDLDRQLCDYMASGGILIIIGRTGAGKTRLLKRLKWLRIIDNTRPSWGRNAPSSPEDVPSEAFAIDEARAHNRRDIVRVITDMGAAKRGFAIVFQSPESFRDYEIGEHFAMQPALFIELSDQGLS